MAHIVARLLFVIAAALPVPPAAAVAATAPATQPADRPRLLVLTDIGGDPDDQQAMVRLMLYTNELEVEGLIASASGTPGELKEKVTKPELIRQIVQAYGQVRPNLLKHAAGYPTAEALLAVVTSGNPDRGKTAVGDGHDTEGSKHLIAAVDRADARPLNISIWGGQTDLAQALWRVRKDRGPDGLAAFVKRFRVYDVNDQDVLAEWMWGEFPGMTYVLAGVRKGHDKREGGYRGVYLGGDESLTSRAWIDANVRTNHGPLGALYPDKAWTAPNPHGVMKEGDTPSWFFFLPRGGNDPADPTRGGWGGRFELDKEAGGGKSRIYRDAAEEKADGKDKYRKAVWQHRPAFQADFAARMNWCVG